MHLPGMFYGKVLRSPHAHARIVSIDTSAAAALPGVKAIVTAADLPAVGDKIEDLGESTGNLRYMSENILAHDKVLYHGHASGRGGRGQRPRGRGSRQAHRGRV